MTADFLSWYEINERQLTGDPKQAAWLAWQAREDARTVAQARLYAAQEDDSRVRHFVIPEVTRG